MSMSASALVNGALRIAGRLVALVLVTGALFFVLGIALKPLMPEGLPSGPDGRRIYLSLLVIALAVGQVLMVAIAEQSDWTLTGLGLDGWSPWALLAGLGIGVAIPVIDAVAAMLFGSTGTGLSWVWPTSSVLIAMLVTSLMDVLLFRGYTIGLIASAWGDVLAVACSAGLATLVMLRFDAPTPMLAIDTFMLASCLGVLRLRTGSLAAAWLAAFVAMLVRDGLGGAAVPGVTAGLLAVVSFLLFRLPARTPMSPLQ